MCCVEYGDLQIFGSDTCRRLEFRQHNGIWGTVCDNGFDVNAALVAFRQLGYDRSKYYAE